VTTLLSDYLDTEQLAAELRLHPMTVVRWRLRKEGPPCTRIGRRPMYKRSAVEKWLAAREEKASKSA
jgi:hypothetical protein